jgi:hypothetical protein
MMRVLILASSLLFASSSYGLSISCGFDDPGSFLDHRAKSMSYMSYDVNTQTLTIGVGYPMEYYEYQGVSEDWTESTAYVPVVTLLSARGTKLFKLVQNWSGVSFYERHKLYPYRVTWLDSFGDTNGRIGACYSTIMSPVERDNR